MMVPLPIVVGLGAMYGAVLLTWLWYRREVG